MSSIGVFASLFDATDRILLVRQAHGSRHWTTPGGRVEAEESPLAALQREVLEEIACEVQVAHLIGVYAKPYRDDLVLSFAPPHSCVVFPEHVRPRSRRLRFSLEESCRTKWRSTHEYVSKTLSITIEG
jgi:ADP-ribose pyrophosphatase YjhB (NUDIX family)